MEEKKNNKGLVWLIVILIILVLGLVGYIIYDRVLKDDKTPNYENTTSTTITTTVINKDDIVYCGEKTTHINNNKIDFKFYYKENAIGDILSDMYVNDKKISSYTINSIDIEAVDNYTKPPKNEYDNSKQINIEEINEEYYLLSYYVSYESDPSNLYLKILDKDFNSIYDFEIVHMTSFDFDDVSLESKFNVNRSHYYIEANEIYYFAGEDGCLDDKGYMPVNKLTINNGKIEKSILGYYSGTIAGYKYECENE